VGGQRGNRTYGANTITAAVARTEEVYGQAPVPQEFADTVPPASIYRVAQEPDPASERGSDTVPQEHEGEATRSQAPSNPETPASDAPKARLSITNACDLLTHEFPPPRWAIPSLLPEGVTVLAGKPKKGKSFMALGFAVAVSTGGKALMKVPVEGGDVLYLALEDHPRRIQDRLQKMGVTTLGPYRLDISTQCPRFTARDQGLDAVGSWAADHPNARLIIVDTLARVRPPRSSKGNIYDDDYTAVASMKELADHYRVSILVIHHLRKMTAEDPMDTVSGSLGLTGAADGIVILEREAGLGDGKLVITGRDVEEQELAINWSRENMQWELLGDAAEYYVSEERAAIRNILRMSGDSMTIKGVADVLGKPQNTVKQLLFKMTHDGQVDRDGKGRYRLPDNPDNPGNHNGTAF
jgi:AAA domain